MCQVASVHFHLLGSAGESALKSTANDQGDIERVTTRQWALQSGYDSSKLFHKLFHDDIEYLLSMHNLWEKRRKPTPLKMDQLPDAGKSHSCNTICLLHSLL